MAFIQTSDTLTTRSLSLSDLSAASKTIADSGLGNSGLGNSNFFKPVKLPPLPIRRPLLMVGHGTRNPKGRQDLVDFC